MDNREAPKKPQLKHLVIDSGAIIKGVHVETLAENFWTTEDVMQEIRDKNARKFLRLLPFDLKTKEPSEEAKAAVASFAHKTGDLRVLSKTDRNIIALAYMLEKETNNGVDHLRKEPVRANNLCTATNPAVVLTAPSRAGLSKSLCKNFSTPEGCSYGEKCRFKHVPICRFFSSSNGCRNGSFCRFLHLNQKLPNAKELVTKEETEEHETEETEKTLETEELSTVETEVPVETEKQITGETEELTEGDTEETEKDKEESQRNHLIDSTIENAFNQLDLQENCLISNSTSKILCPTGGMSSVEYIEDGIDDNNWINSDNFIKFKESPFGNSSIMEPNKGVKVGIITTDYSMQNVILQMGLKLFSADGMVIGRVKQWILRCFACRTVTSEMNRIFCSKCGNSTLERVSFSMDSNGNIKIYLRSDRPVNLLGTKYSLPTPKGGRDGDLLLREDQLMMGVWNQRNKKAIKKVTSAFGEDVTSKLGIQVVKKDVDIQFGYGRKNPNSMRGRERRGKKKRSTA